MNKKNKRKKKNERKDGKSLQAQFSLFVSRISQSLHRFVGSKSNGDNNDNRFKYK